MRRKVDAGLKLSVIEQYKSSRQIDQSKTYCTPVVCGCEALQWMQKVSSMCKLVSPASHYLLSPSEKRGAARTP